MTDAVDAPFDVNATMFAGTWSTGPIVSTTVTTKLAEPRFPAASVARHVTVVTPIANVEPLTGEHAAFVEPSTLSSALAENENFAPAGVVA